MKQLKRIVSVALVFAICMMPLEIQAAGKDVTSSMKGDKYIKKVVRDLSSCMAAQWSNEPTANKMKKERLTGYNALSIAAYVKSENKMSDFYTAKELQKVTYNLFGIRPKTNAIPKMNSPKRRWVARTEYNVSKKPYMFSGWIWEGHVPKYAIKKVVKVKKNVYDITVTTKLYDRYGKKNKTIGTTYIRVQKNAKSSYKYKVTQLKFKGSRKAL